MTALRPSVEHGVPGHLNAFMLDQDCESTGYGTHARCIVTGSLDGREVTVHVDHNVPHLRGLADPTADQVRKVAMGERRIHGRGRLSLRESVDWLNLNNGHRCTEHRFDVT